MAFEIKFSDLMRLLIGGDFYSKKYGTSQWNINELPKFSFQIHLFKADRQLWN